MLKIGTTERGDAGLDLSWSCKLHTVNAAVLITKDVNNAFINEVIRHKDKVIVHATVTGYGGTILEPNVKTVSQSWDSIHELISRGFSSKQIVLRVDPIVPTEKGIQVALNVMKEFQTTGIRRVRYSFINMYQHVVKRLTEAGIRNPYEGNTNDFYPSMEQRNAATEAIKSLSGIYEFESCAEYNEHRIGCISQKDLDILGIQGELTGSAKQRKSCLCPAAKTELLTNMKQCPHKCLYCYWR